MITLCSHAALFIGSSPSALQRKSVSSLLCSEIKGCHVLTVLQPLLLHRVGSPYLAVWLLSLFWFAPPAPAKRLLFYCVLQLDTWFSTSRVASIAETTKLVNQLFVSSLFTGISYCCCCLLSTPTCLSTLPNNKNETEEK